MKKMFLLFIAIASNAIAQQWINLNPQLSTYYSKIVYMVNSNTGFLATSKEVWKTKDGQNFYKVFFDENVELKNLSVFGKNVILCSANKIITSADSGETFTVNSFTGYINTFKFVDEKHGWGLASENRIARTTDAGASWIYYQPPVAPYDIYFSDTLNGFMTTSASVKAFYKTTNGGYSWVSVYTGISMEKASIAFYNRNTGYIYSYLNSMFTTDGGVTWTTKYTRPITLIRNNIGLSYDANYVYPKNMYYTTDYGDTWKYIFVPQLFQPALDILSPTEFWMGSTNGSIYKTTNAGINWTTVTPPAFGFYDGFFLDDKHGWLYHNHIMRTTDGGFSWKPILFKDQFNSMYFHDANNGFSVMQSGSYSAYSYWLSKNK